MDIEQLISQYLDGELSSEEEGEFHHKLSGSPEARALFREHLALQSVARDERVLHRPTEPMHNALFAQLQEEEGMSPVGAMPILDEQESVAMPSPALTSLRAFPDPSGDRFPVASTGDERRRRRRLMPILVPLMLLCIAGGAWLYNGNFFGGNSSSKRFAYSSAESTGDNVPGLSSNRERTSPANAFASDDSVSALENNAFAMNENVESSYLYSESINRGMTDRGTTERDARSSSQSSRRRLEPEDMTITAVIRQDAPTAQDVLNSAPPSPAPRPATFTRTRSNTPVRNQLIGNNTISVLSLRENDDNWTTEAEVADDLSFANTEGYPVEWNEGELSEMGDEWNSDDVVAVTTLSERSESQSDAPLDVIPHKPMFFVGLESSIISRLNRSQASLSISGAQSFSGPSGNDLLPETRLSLGVELGSQGAHRFFATIAIMSYTERDVTRTQTTSRVVDQVIDTTVVIVDASGGVSRTTEFVPRDRVSVSTSTTVRYSEHHVLEFWGGVGYRFSIKPGEAWHTGLEVVGGVGTDYLHASFTIPVSYALGNTFRLEFKPGLHYRTLHSSSEPVTTGTLNPSATSSSIEERVVGPYNKQSLDGGVGIGLILFLD